MELELLLSKDVLDEIGEQGFGLFVFGGREGADHVDKPEAVA